MGRVDYFIIPENFTVIIKYSSSISDKSSMTFPIYSSQINSFLALACSCIAGVMYMHVQTTVHLDEKWNRPDRDSKPGTPPTIVVCSAI